MLKNNNRASIERSAKAPRIILLWYVCGVFAASALFVLATDFAGIHLWDRATIFGRFVYYWAAAFLIAGSWIFRTFHLSNHGLFSYGVGPWLHACMFTTVLGGPSAYAVWTYFRSGTSQSRSNAESGNQKILTKAEVATGRWTLCAHVLIIYFALGFWVLGNDGLVHGILLPVLHAPWATAIANLYGLIILFIVPLVTLFLAMVKLRSYFIGMASTVAILLVSQAFMWWCIPCLP